MTTEQMQTTFYPFTMPQYSIHTQEMAFPNTDINNLYFVIQIHESMQEAYMREAIRAFVQNTQAAHTRICMDGDSPVQYFASGEPAHVKAEDLTGMTSVTREELYREWGQKPFTYYDSPLFEFRILQIADDESGLFCKFHHIWCDGWSTGLVWSKILTEYCRLCAGRQLDSLHADVEADVWTAAIQESAVYPGSERYHQDKAFFQQYLKTAEPGDKYAVSSKEAIAPVNTHIARRSPAFAVPEHLSVDIQAFCRAQEVTPYTVFMSALAIYESGIAAKEEVLLGAARLNRDTAEERAAVGQFVTEIPLRIKLDADLTFAGLCRMILSESRNVAVHKKYPMASIVKNYRKATGYRNDLIKHSLSFQREKIQLGGYTLPIDMWFGSPSISVEEAVIHVVDLLANGYQIFYDYQKAHYDEITIYNFHESLVAIIEQGIRGNDSVFMLPLTGVRERESLSAPPNETIDVPFEHITILDMFKWYVEQEPDRMAIAGTDGSFSFQQADKLSDSMAAYMQKKGLLTEDVVGVYLPRTCAVFFALMGIMKAGGCFILLDTDYPQERVHTIISDSGMKYIITNEDEMHKLDGCAAAVCLMDTIEEACFDPVPIRSRQLCYMIYTSGTTGKPKGVQIEHRSIYNLLRPEHSQIAADVADIGEMAVAMGALSFDIFLFEIFTNLMNGVSVVIASGEEMKNPHALAQLMEKYGVNVLYGTPSRLLSYCGIESFCQAFSRVNIVLSAGEAFPETLYYTLRKLACNLHIYNGYGPTEAAIGTSFQRVCGTDITLGRPVVNYKLRCMDFKGRVLPYGKVGELYIGGIGLARGYSDKTLTEQSFVYVNGERFYKSGDLVYRKPDNELIFYGRKDNQIKLNGFRIELEEIESTIRLHRAVKEAAVIVKKSGNAELLCAYYTADHNIPQEELKKLLAGRLPYYMVPSVFKGIETLPVTVNGKVDKCRLADIEVQYQQQYTAPETAQQKILTTILEELLEIEKVGIDDNFFDIGGDSLLVARYAVEALACGMKFEYSDIFRYPTIRQFCAHMEQQGTKTEDIDLSHSGCCVPASKACNTGCLDEYDYTDINRLLENQTSQGAAEHPLRHVLLTGATGYLGIHILNELLKHTDAIVYCLLRDNKKRDPKKALSGKYYYYFEESLSDVPEGRIKICVGDMAESDLPELLSDIPLDAVINCAADVAHYSHGAKMKQINTESLRGIVALCKAKHAQLIHISTISVGQFGIDAVTDAKTAFSENDFYFAQDLTNEYIRSKFLAERIILEAMAAGELQGYIARVGNLQGRYADGEFQINYKTNAFVIRLKAYMRLGFMPNTGMEGAVDYSPIDCVAEAICLLAQFRSEQHIYHILNDKETTNAMFFHVLKEQGYTFEVLSKDAYEERVKMLLADVNERELLADMAADLTMEMEGKYQIPIDCEKTAAVLKTAGFSWPKIDKKYLKLYIKGLEMLGFFDDDIR